MSTMTAITRPTITRPAPRRVVSGPAAARPALSPRHVAISRPVACQVAAIQPSWQLTRRGVVVVTSFVAAVLCSALVTCVLAFLSVSNLPL